MICAGQVWVMAAAPGHSERAARERPCQTTGGVSRKVVFGVCGLH